jgi:hypothetical protein
MTTATAARFRIRQSYLRHLEEHCPAMAYALNVEGLEGPSGAGAERGTAVHDFFSRYVEHLYQSGRATDWDAVGRILSEVFKDYPALTLEQFNDVKAQAEAIAQVFLMRPTLYYGSEESFETTIPLADGREATVTGRIDYLEIEGETARLKDVKTNHQILPDSQVKNDFQLGVYAMLVLDNLPHIEFVEGSLLLSRYGISLPQKGTAVWTREDSKALKEHLSVKVDAHFAGKLKNERIPGTWCQYCPLRRLNHCTLYRSYYGTTPPPPANDEQARKLARQIIALEDARETRLALIKQYVNDNGPIGIGSGEYAEVFGFHKRESEEVSATDLLAILEQNRSLVGNQPLDELLSVKKTSRTYKNLRYHAELRGAFDDVAQIRVSTLFGHKKVGESDGD